MNIKNIIDSLLLTRKRMKRRKKPFTVRNKKKQKIIKY
jgi:hypothetical protein